MIATSQLLSQLTNEKESFYSSWIYRSKNYMILHKPWKRKGQKERECANLASTSIVLKRAGLWGQHSSEEKDWRSPSRCPKTEGHILRDQIKKPIANNCPKETADMRSPAKVFFYFFGGVEGKEESILAITRENPSMEDQFKFKESMPCLASFGILEESWAVYRPGREQWNRWREHARKCAVLSFPMAVFQPKETQREGGKFNFNEVSSLSSPW